MKTIDENGLLELVIQAAESMAFMLVDGSDEVSLDHGDPNASVSIALSGAAAGVVRIEAFGAFGEEFARGLTGVDEDEPVSADDLRAAMGELANTLGGSVVRYLGGAELNIKLGLPEHDAPAPKSRNTVVAVVASDLGGLKVVWHNDADSQSGSAAA